MLLHFRSDIQDRETPHIQADHTIKKFAFKKITTFIQQLFS